MKRIPSDDDSPPPAGQSHPVAGCLVTLLVMTAMLLAAAVIAVRTRGGLDLLSDYLSDSTGIELTVGKARVALPYDLVLEDLRTRGGGSTNGDVAVREIRLHWQLNGAPVVKIRGAELTMVRSGTDGWRPESFAAVGALSDVRKTPALFNDEPRLTLDVRDSAIRWTEGTNTWGVEGFGLRSVPVRVGAQSWRYFEVQADRVTRAGGAAGRAVRRVWLSISENPYLEVTYRGVWDEGGPAGHDWWSSPPPAASPMGVP